MRKPVSRKEHLQQHKGYDHYSDEESERDHRIWHRRGKAENSQVKVSDSDEALENNWICTEEAEGIRPVKECCLIQKSFR